MKELFYSAKYLAEDMASMILFGVVLEFSHNVPLAVGLGMALGVSQIVWHLVRKEKVDAMQWLSVSLVIIGGAATLLTKNPLFVMLKPSVISAAVGVFMLKRGWMNRYLPPVAQEWTPDIGILFGYIWAGLEFFTAGLNIFIAVTFDPLSWGKIMSVFGIASMVGLFLIQFSIMRVIGERRHARQAGSVTPAAA